MRRDGPRPNILHRRKDEFPEGDVVSTQLSGACDDEQAVAILFNLWSRMCVIRIFNGEIMELECSGPSGSRHSCRDGTIRRHPRIERAISAFARSSNGGLIVTAAPLALFHRDLIVTLAARHKLCAVYSVRAYVTSGGLMYYGSDIYDL